MDIMCKVNPEHNKNIGVNSLLKVLYIPIMKAQYIFMDSTLLWYDLCSKTMT